MARQDSSSLLSGNFVRRSDLVSSDGLNEKRVAASLPSMKSASSLSVISNPRWLFARFHAALNCFFSRRL